ncbi:MAG: ribonuclease III [Deltaproteobacteria bacterium]|nr:ribonuclease III [Deltaproteobacteria bacterium]
MPDPHDVARRRLHEALGHEFEQEALLADALTHRSFKNERPDLARTDNERLEFLGDAVLGMGVAVLLADAYPDVGEGALTRLRADVVCEASLAAVARSLEVGDALRLGKGEERSGGRDKPRLLASAMEAIVGAVLTDGGTGPALELVERLFADQVAQASGQRDVKSRLQEWAQREKGATPAYRVVRAEGPDHERVFHVAVELEGTTLAEGTGRSKAEAERSAARKALDAREAE